MCIYIYIYTHIYNHINKQRHNTTTWKFAATANETQKHISIAARLAQTRGKLCEQSTLIATSIHIHMNK